jgi:hypothetical protein
LGHFAILISAGFFDNNNGDNFDEFSDQFVALLIPLFISVFDSSNLILASSSIECCRRRQQYRKQTIREAIIIHIITNSKLKRIGKRILRDFRDDFVVVAVIIVISFDFVVNAVSVVVFGDVIFIVLIQSVFVAINMGVIDIGSSVCSLLVEVVSSIVVDMDVF